MPVRLGDRFVSSELGERIQVRSFELATLRHEKASTVTRSMTTHTVPSLGTLLLALAFLCGCAGRAVTSREPAPLVAPSAAVGIEAIGGGNVAVEFVVAAVKERIAKRGIVYLDSHSEFTDPENLCVALSASAAEELRRQGVTDLDGHFRGKRIRARGSVMRFEERRYLPVLAADHIEIVADVAK